MPTFLVSYLIGWGIPYRFVNQNGLNYETLMILSTTLLRLRNRTNCIKNHTVYLYSYFSFMSTPTWNANQDGGKWGVAPQRKMSPPYQLPIQLHHWNW